MRKLVVAGIVAGSLALGASGTAVAEAAASANTSTSTNTLISAKCYHHHSVGVTQFRWVKAANRYEAYSSPRTHTSDYNTCHK